MSIELTLDAFESQTANSFQERAENISRDNLLQLLDNANYTLSPQGQALLAELHTGYSYPKTVYEVALFKDRLRLRRGTDAVSFKDFRFNLIYKREMLKAKEDQKSSEEFNRRDINQMSTM